MNSIQRKWQSWRLKYTSLLIISLIIFFFIARLPAVVECIHTLSYYGMWGALVAGVFFVSAYTAIPAGFVLFELGNYSDPFQVAIFGGLGAMIGDYLIFRFVRDQLYAELKPHLRWLSWLRNRRKKKSALLRILMPTLGALIIISPFPDEIGVGLIGISRMNKPMFLVLTYVLNAIGIYLLALVAQNT